jgi:hypothetical protein
MANIPLRIDFKLLALVLLWNGHVKLQVSWVYNALKDI